ncbi:MAG: hypothetical protein U0166_02890 [Acidobacteriota bacterium]
MRIACIGSREISPGVRRALWNVGRLLALAGHDVVSGNARGADQAFAGGVNFVDRAKLRLCLPWAGYEQDAIRKGNKVMVAWESRYAVIASKNHPCWSELGAGVRPLMARNVAIVEGVDLVIAYPSLQKSWGGGTGFGILLGRALGKPVVDLARADGLDHLLHALEDLPWPESQDMLLELVWLQRLGGRLDRGPYEDRMLAIGAVLMAELSGKSSDDLGSAIERLPASLLWRMLDGRDFRHLPWYDEEDCIDWQSVFGGLREDPIRDRVLMPYVPPRGRTVEEDPDAPETELRRIFQVHDTGNPVWDREAAGAMLHHGERRWLESSVAMPSGMVLQRSDTPSRWRDPSLHLLKEASWDFFRRSLGQPETAASRYDALRQPWVDMVHGADYELLARLREVLSALELDVRSKDRLIQDIREEVAQRSKTRAGVDPVTHRASVARVVLREWIVRLYGIAAGIGAWTEEGRSPSAGDGEDATEPVEPLPPVPAGSGIDWSIVQFRIRDRYPMAHQALVDFAMDSARKTWVQWQSAPESVIALGDDEGEEAAMEGLVPAGSSESFLTGVGHLYRPVLDWEDWQPRKVRDLLASIRTATTRSELVMLSMEVESFTRDARHVLDTALSFARERVKRVRATRRARFARHIEASCSIRRLERAREKLALDPRLRSLRGAIDRRIAALKTLRAGRLTEDLKSRVVWDGRTTETGEFGAGRWREAIRRQLGGRPKPELLDKLLEDARVLWEIGSRAGDVERVPALS